MSDSGNKRDLGDSPATENIRRKRNAAVLLFLSVTLFVVVVGFYERSIDAAHSTNRSRRQLFNLSLDDPKTVGLRAQSDQFVPQYDPLKCNNMKHGHCQDEQGGAWSYHNPDGSCTHNERNVPRDAQAMRALPGIFPDVKDSVLDFGGGVGAYMTSFRDAGVQNLVVIEPHDLGDCLFHGLRQERMDVINTPLSELPKMDYDLVMTVEVCEHFPVEHHPKVISALIQASRKWLLFSAAHPGQDGEGHIGPSMKWRDEWIKEITDLSNGEWALDIEMTGKLFEASMTDSLLKTNAFIMRRIGG